MAEQDILTTTQNHVVATNSLNQTWINFTRAQLGDRTSQCITTATAVEAGPGRLVGISVVEAGTKGGFIYDASTIESPAAIDRLMAIPEQAGIYGANLLFTNGIVIIPGEGQAVVLTYMMD